MWRHAKSRHNGIIDDPRKYFKYVLLGFFRDNLGRHCNEGSRQTRLEDLQQQGKVTVLNSKIDFTRPFMVNLNMQR